MRSQIEGSVVGHDCEGVMYPVGIWEGTLTGSWWHKPKCCQLAVDKLVSIQGIANSNNLALQANYVADAVDTLVS